MLKSDNIKKLTNASYDIQPQQIVGLFGFLSHKEIEDGHVKVCPLIQD